MPRYRLNSGVVVSIPEEKAERIDGLTLVDTPPSPRRRQARKTTKKSESDSE